MTEYAFKPAEVARIIHAANIEVQAIRGHDVISQPWFYEPLSQRKIVINGVAMVRRHNLSARQNHELWRGAKLAAGWRYGAEKDPERKTHPCMVPWHKLPAENRDQAVLFVAIVHALSRRVPRFSCRSLHGKVQQKEK